MVQRNRHQAQQRTATSHAKTVRAVPATEALPANAPAKLLLTPLEAAAALGIGRTTMFKLLLSGEIPSIKVGRMRRIPITALSEWVINQTAA